MSSVLEVGYNQVRKNDFDFSFISAMFDLVGNKEFKSAQLSTLCSDYDTPTTNVWRTLSAIGQELGSKFNENIVNFIDNVSNVELCKTHDLASLASMTGIKYTVFQNISLFPQDIIKLLDVLSMKREHLLNAEKMDHKLTKLLSSMVLDNDVEVADLCEEINHERQRILTVSSDMSSLWQPEVSATSYIDDQKLDTIISSMYKELILDKISQTYNDFENTLIYKHLSSSILLSGFALPNVYASDIRNLKIQNNVPLTFNEQTEADLIDDMVKSLDQYSEYEQEILELEMKRRYDAFNSLQPQTRYKFYREREVREYFKFIEQQYTNLSGLYESAGVYEVDPTYISLDNNYVQTNCLIDDKCRIKMQMIDAVAVMLLNMTSKVRGIREQLKSQIQKNFMRGSYLLLQYMINEYLKSTVIPNINALQLTSTAKYDQETSSYLPISVSWDPNKTGNDLIEYSDATQYFNISTEIDVAADKCNERYWEQKETPLVDYPDDSTNIFKLHSVVNQKNFVFSIEELEHFYRKILKNRFNPDNPEQQEPTEQNKHLNKFLSTVFDFGAETTFMDLSGDIQTLIDGKIQPKTWIDLAALIAEKYFALSVYDVGMFDLSGTTQDQLAQLSSLFIDSRAATFDVQKQEIISNVRDSLSTGIKQSISYDAKQLRTDFNALTTTYSGLVLVPLTSPYVANNISTFMQMVDLSCREAAQPSVQIMLRNLSSQVLDISSDYDKLYNGNKDKTSQQLNSISWNYFDVYAASVDFTPSIQPKPEAPKAYLEDVVSCYESVLSVNSDSIEHAQSTFDTRLCAALQAYDRNWQTLNAFSTVISDFLSSDIQISGVAVSVFNALSAYDNILSAKEVLFRKYTGLSIGEMPYMNLENRKHPSYQIHPCLSNFVEIDDMLYPIENTVALVNENLEGMISGYVNDYFDKEGYLKDIWKNPLNVNSDYMSRYEATSHTNAMNNEDPVFGYDGLFYPATLTTYFDKTDKFIAAVRQNQDLPINAYFGLNLTNSESKFIANQLETFQNIIRAEASQEYHDIYRYGLDLYGNQYILVKSYPTLSVHTFEDLLKVDQQTRKTTPGVLWVKFKNHPIAFPAFALTYKKMLDGTKLLQYAKQSNIYISDNDDDANLVFADEGLLKFQKINDSNYYAPCIYDFTVTKGKTILLFNAQTTKDQEWPLLGKISQFHDQETDRTVRKLLADRKGDNAVEGLIEEDSLKDYEGYQFIKYFNIGMYPGAMFYKNNGTAQDPLFSFKGRWYDYSSRSSFDDCRHEVATGTDISVDQTLTLLSGAEVCFDICTDKDQKNACILKMAYLTDKLDATNLSNYQNVQIPSYQVLSRWIDTPTNCIVTRDFTVWPDTIEEQLDTQRIYLPYTDHGFNPLHENVENDSADTQLPYHLLKKRGILKYQMLGRNKAYGIDFKYVIPIRMFDPYTVSADPRYTGMTPDMHYDNLSAADYMMQHFDESMLSSGCQLIDTDGSIYDLYEFKQKIPNWKLGLRVDEEYISFMKARGFNPRDPLVDYTYLWRANAENGFENNIPRQYIYACNTDYASQLTSEFDLNLFKNRDGYHHLSVSWYYANDSLGIDINSYYYTVLDENNVFNRKHKFLSLPRSGDGGVLQEWKDAENEGEEDKLLATYFIKNISDDKPRFLLSVSFNAEDEIIEHNIVPETNFGVDKFVVEFDLENMDLVTEEGTKLIGEQNA